MSEDNRSSAIDHLLTDPVHAALDRSAYGDWRKIASADAVALSFGFPDPDLFPEPELVESVEAVLREDGENELQYGGGEYTAALESFLVEQEKERGVDFETEELLVTNGATHAIDSVCRAFLERGDTILVEGPTFMGVLGVFRNFGVDIVTVPVDNEGMDADALRDILESRRERGLDSPKLLYTIPDYHNPTGTTLSRARRERVLELSRAHDFAIIEDGAYSDMWFGEEPPPALTALDDAGRVVRVGTFSKTVAPGVRLGWLTAPSPIYRAVRSVAAGGTNTFTQGVIGRYCQGGHFDALVPEMRRTYAEKRDHMLAELETHMPADATWTEPDGGFFVWVELPDGMDTSGMLDGAIDAGVTYLPGSMFYPDGGGENALRLSFTFVKQDEITAGIETLGACIEAER